MSRHDIWCVRLRTQQHPRRAADAFRAGTLTSAQPGPVDRMLAAQAMLGQDTLIKRDALFTALPGLETL